jgi:hypothetical protein
MKTYATSAFSKLAAKEDVSDDDLREAIARAERNQVDGPLGGHLIKQRVARQGQGRSGGFRTIIFYKRGKVALFLHMFAKSERANLTKKEQAAYHDYADQLAEHTDEQFSRLVAERGWREIEDEQPEEDVPK